MGKRGPAPLPTAVKRLRGNPGKRTLSNGEPRPATADRTPGAPRWLSEEGRKAWRKIAPILHGAQLLTDADVMGLGMLCEAFALFMDARDTVAVEGLFIQSERGGVYQHPAVGVMNRARADLLRWAVQFGMTPSARSRIAVSPADETDDLAEWFFGEVGS